MATLTNDKVLSEVFGPQSGTALRVKQVALVIVGVAILAVAAKIRVPMWPVPITMGTFAVLGLGAAYGARLGLVTIVSYMVLGALGLNVFAGSGAEASGIAYMLGGTGGYLFGYVVAVAALGYLARRGWDRSVMWMAAAMLIGNVIIYVPGLAWLVNLYGLDAPILEWGLTPFLIGDALKLVLAALILPAAWKLVGNARG
ncbi:biotin transporter BioY [Maritimibacter sp. UBA3975]|uniref:biotin transporter BioY n=1 Tax=Maritimibacter sp. UBA3975 TaxID=1946833 RepID=UPI000C0B7FB9|nr:biotin transporter BioY [Maritimibacter sp. UBA3975]MAM61092.1 biotin transporter BioY [Maritimibacter sp.]|tara:strand:- start:21672 stop:22271 length:600 start_codon:yes stop_codon:yes gene_type:complete